MLLGREACLFGNTFQNSGPGLHNQSWLMPFDKLRCLDSLSRLPHHQKGPVNIQWLSQSTSRISCPIPYSIGWPEAILEQGFLRLEPHSGTMLNYLFLGWDTLRYMKGVLKDKSMEYQVPFRP
jgi:hypothetical protein